MERIGSQHGFEALRSRLVEVFQKTTTSGTQEGGAIDKVLDAETVVDTSVGSLETMRKVVNEHDDRIEALEARLSSIPFPG